MKNLPLIKWHAQELCSLLEEEPENAMFAKVLVDLEAIILNSSLFKNIQAAPPAVADE
jgi:hypothetical protein